jgi:hypothetical protein
MGACASRPQAAAEVRLHNAELPLIRTHTKVFFVVRARFAFACSGEWWVCVERGRRRHARALVSCAGGDGGGGDSRGSRAQSPIHSIRQRASYLRTYLVTLEGELVPVPLLSGGRSQSDSETHGCS